jgi:hypothetical protein
MPAPHFPQNWTVGWILLLTAFLTGAGMGLFFHRDDFWGGYASFRRRIVRLGHIALAALGLINVVFSLSPWPAATSAAGANASLAWIVGAISMPIVCFLSGWRQFWRYLFVVPVVALVLAVYWTLAGVEHS